MVNLAQNKKGTDNTVPGQFKANAGNLLSNLEGQTRKVPPRSVIDY